MQQVAAEPGPAPGVSYADIVTRIIAMFIDGLIVFIPFAIIGAVLSFVGWIGSLLAAVVLVGGSAAYFVYTWTTMRASYGQKFMKLETVSAADGSTLTQQQAIRRWAFLLGPAAATQVIAALPFLWALGGLLSLVAGLYELYLLYTCTQSSKRQGLHDTQAGTVVIKHA
jgi:uncharacterized RDD family membrane protein YckC